ncbi:MAG TPA: MFS transporter [Gammaproteobacteria bacterium]|nr:MFS transporter [Chromatiales bacterium]MCP4925324.1 MFS transporter [Gammaproteobacteria bacterium]MDP7660881.1 MFS transporter [Gammaproteobacteria bacterium]HJP37719.1 MFS transporter [Gammaproteobacteria bacterium]
MSEQNYSSAPGIKIGFLELAPGISRGNFYSFVYSAFSTIGLLTFISVATTLVLNTHLQIPTDQQGTISGQLVFVTEITQILLFAVVGVMADRIGRSQLLAIGMLVMGLSYVFYPFAESVSELTIYRILYAIGLGTATGMLATVTTDYPQEESRGKFVAFGGVFNGLGVIAVVAILGGLPEFLVQAGYDEVKASLYTHYTTFGCCVFSALVAWFGLKKGVPVKHEKQLPLSRLASSGLRAAKNPRIALAYAAAFVARGDLVILGTFSILWGATAAIDQGIDPSEAVSKGRMIFVIATSAALAWIPFMAMIMDRFNRVTTMILCMTLAALGYLFIGFVDNPLDLGSVWPFFVFLGVGQISAFLGAQTLIGQEAPALQRGAVVGVFNTAGAIGILVSSWFGGMLFDSIAPAAPFVLIGIMNGFVALFALIVRIKSPGLAVRRGTDPELN